MKPVNEGHFAILRRHMVEVVGIQAELMSEELASQVELRLRQLGYSTPRVRTGEALVHFDI